MVGKWLVVLPLFVDFNKVILQPITEENNVRRARQLRSEDCCPCRDEDTGSVRDSLMNSLSRLDCPCPRESDAEASASILLPALRAIQPFVKQADQKSDPKPLLQPEVGLASSVLETLRQATDEEYQDALARDAARNAVKSFEPDLSSIGHALTETPKNIVRIFLNPKDDMDDNLPEQSHIQETRCIHSPLESVHDYGQLRMPRPTPIIEVFNSPRKPNKKLKHKNLFHRNQYEMDSGVGASNIQERVISPNTDGIIQDIRLKSNPTLFDLFSKHKADDTDESQTNDAKNVDDRINKLKQVTPKSNFKLRDLIDSLDVKSDNEKPKLPVIDLKKYFATTTKLPPLKFKPFEKTAFRTNTPLQLKDLLKLKDVELIPRKELANNKPKLNKSLLSNANVKSRMSTDYDNNNNNEKYNHCEEEDTNTASSINQNIITVGSETSDSGTSQTKLEPDLISDLGKTVDNSNNDEIRGPISEECLDLENDDLNLIASNPISVGDQENYDDCYNEADDGPSITLINDDSNRKNSNEDLNNNGIEKENKQNVESNEDINNDESISDAYQIELLEDLNYPVEFDNSSLVPETDLKDTDKIQNNEIQTIKEKLSDPIMENSDTDLQIIEQNDDQPSTPQVFLKNTPVECKSFDQSAEYSNPVDLNDQVLLAGIETVKDKDNIHLNNANQYFNSPQKSRQAETPSYHEEKKINPLKQKSSHVDHMKGDGSHVSFSDLQEMSNTLLNLSDNEFEKRNKNTNNLVNENLKVPNDDSTEMDYTELSANNPSLEELKETVGAPNFKATLIRNPDKSEIADQQSDKNYCKPAIVEDKSNHIIEAENENMAKNLDIEKDAENTEDSKTDSNSNTYTNLKLKESKTPLFRNNIRDVIDSKTFSKPDITNILQDNKQSKIIDDLKSKIENLFGAPGKVIKSDDFTAPEDNVNESSNMKPIVTNFDESDLNQFQRTPQTLRETLLPNIPGLNLGSYKSKLAVPKSLDRAINLDPDLNSRIGLLSTPSARKDNQREYKRVQYTEPHLSRNPSENIDRLRSTITSNSKKFLNSPLESRPFEDTWDPSSALTDLSDRLRSHTENAIHNVKQTLESRLRDSQTDSFRRPSDTIDASDILESISNRRDEFNDKLQAIHSDINDRFSTFQQSILDQFSNRAATNFEDDMGKIGLKSNNIPLKQQSPKEFPKPRFVANKQNQKSLLPNSVLDNSDSTDKFKSPKPSKLSPTPRLKNSEKLTPNLNSHLESLRNGKLFDGLSYPRQHTLPIVPKDDRTLLLQKSSATTTRPSLIPRPKTLKGLSDSVPKLNNDIFLKARQSKIPVLTDAELTKEKIRLQPERRNKLLDQPNSSPTHSLPSRISQSESNSNTGKIETNLSEEDSTVSRMDKIKKALLQRNPEFKSKSALKLPTPHWHLPNSALKNRDGDENGRKSSYKTVTLGKNIEDELSSYVDARQSAAQNIEDIKLVEPLRENVPYKCKLICYKDA